MGRGEQKKGMLGKGERAECGEKNKEGY
jgi:hypothetical protein